MNLPKTKIVTIKTKLTVDSWQLHNNCYCSFQRSTKGKISMLFSHVHFLHFVDLCEVCYITSTTYRNCRREVSSWVSRQTYIKYVEIRLIKVNASRVIDWWPIGTLFAHFQVLINASFSCSVGDSTFHYDIHWH